MPKVPIINGAKLIKVLKKKGFVLNRISGSHHILIHQEKQITISVPVHKGTTLGKGITKNSWNYSKVNNQTCFGSDADATTVFLSVDNV